MQCLHNEAARTYENTSFISSYGSFSTAENYMSADFVQGNQSAVLHIGDECTVGEGAFVDVRIFGVGLKEGLRVVSSITCMATPCTVAVVTSAGSDMSCSKSDFSIDLNVETLCPSLRSVIHAKAWTEPARTEALASPPANKLSPATRRRPLSVLRV